MPGGPRKTTLWSVAEEEHEPGILRRAELAVDRESEDVAVEPATAPRIGPAEQDAAAGCPHAGSVPCPSPRSSSQVAVSARCRRRFAPAAARVVTANAGRPVGR